MSTDLAVNSAQQAFTSPGPTLNTTMFDQAVQTLIPVNAAHLPAVARTPAIITKAGTSKASVLTTDFFAFDDAADTYGLRTYQPTTRAVEMDDSALPLACADIQHPPPWVSARNASDPQMTGTNVKDEAKQAAAIYETFGYWTTCMFRDHLLGADLIPHLTPCARWPWP